MAIRIGFMNLESKQTDLQTRPELLKVKLCTTAPQSSSSLSRAVCRGCAPYHRFTNSQYNMSLELTKIQYKVYEQKPHLKCQQYASATRVAFTHKTVGNRYEFIYQISSASTNTIVQFLFPSEKFQIKIHTNYQDTKRV